MNKVITINLNGVAYQLEESGYEALRDYLDRAARRLDGNPDQGEIIADIEQAIADKFRAVLGAHKTVVVTKEVEAVIAEMGPVQDASESAAEPAPGATGARAAGEGSGPSGHQTPGAEGTSPDARRRLYKIMDGAKIFGVCNGLAAYFDIDVTIVRVGFAFLAFMWGSGLLLYVLMALILPKASTPAEKASASGGPSTAEDFVRRAKAGYYEGMKTFHDRDAHREWRRKFKQEMRGWRRNFHWQMHQNARQWRQDWPQHPRFPLGPMIIWPLSIFIQLLLFAVAAFAVISLVSDGNVFGFLLPAGIPVWIGVIFLIVVYHFLSLPLRGWRHACRVHAGYGYRSHPGGFFDAVIGLGFLVMIVWLADHYIPPVHAALQNLPPVIHRTMDSVQAWWAKR
jgi:phage shock protein PspC (stress-responsive transcriptional regulator)